MSASAKRSAKAPEDINVVEFALFCQRLDVVGDAENFLHQHEAAFAVAMGADVIGRQLGAVTLALKGDRLALAAILRLRHCR